MLWPKKSALFVRAIGEERTRSLMALMNEEEIIKLTAAINELDVIEAVEAEAFFEEFTREFEKPSELGGAPSSQTSARLDIEISDTSVSENRNTTDFLT